MCTWAAAFRSHVPANFVAQRCTGYLKECDSPWWRKRHEMSNVLASFIGGEGRGTATELNKYFTDA